MNERDVLAKFNSLLTAGMSLQDAERTSGASELDGEVGRNYEFFRNIAIDSGASPGLAIRRMQQLELNRREVEARVRLAMAGPKATALLVHWLPVAALLLGQLSGLESLTVFFRAPLALIPVLLGACLLLVASIWSSRILKTVDVEGESFFELDALAICQTAGMQFEDSIAVVESAMQASLNRTITESAQNEIALAQNLSQSTGVAVAKLLLARADEIRAQLNYKKLEMVERLSIKLLMPLGIFVLPAFVLIAVLPMSIAMITKGST